MMRVHFGVQRRKCGGVEVKFKRFENKIVVGWKSNLKGLKENM